jgi:hypothetical protein
MLALPASSFPIRCLLLASYQRCGSRARMQRRSMSRPYKLGFALLSVGCRVIVRLGERVGCGLPYSGG